MEQVKRHYRADIDGMRAIAVMAVILFHLGISPFTGGFVGVDVFFVISGYLITGIIVREMDEGRFSILRFYERRARRIAPALFAVVIATLVLGFLIFLPNDLVSLGRSVLATLFMVANIFWWNDVDYFAAPPDTKPLLHMWSLGVEEQFYLFLPFILWLVAGKTMRRARPYVLLFLLLASLIACIGMTNQNATTAFFWLPFRAWELFIGGMLVFLPTSDKVSGWFSWVFSWTGLALLLLPIFKLTSQSVFPGMNAVAPALGSALIIWTGSGRKPLINKILSLLPFVWVGLISYSLYLWHWPIIVFLRYWQNDGVLSNQTIVLAFALTFACSAISYRIIEQPFRVRKDIPRATIFKWTVTGVLVLGLVGFGYSNRKGLPARMPEDVLQYARAYDDSSVYQWHCLQGKAPPDLDPDGKCHIGNKAVKPNFLLWGDSFAAALAPGLDELTRKEERSGLLVAASACMPIIGMGSTWEPARERCQYIQNHILDEIDARKPDTVIIAANWYLLLTGEGFRWIEAEKRGSFEDTLAAAFDKTIAGLRQRHVRIIIVSGIPVVGFDVPTALARQALRGKKPEVFVRLDEVHRQNSLAYKIFAKYQGDKDITFISPEELMCKDGRCITEADGHSLYFDGAHLSTHGARFVAPMFKPLLQDEGRE